MRRCYSIDSYLADPISRNNGWSDRWPGRHRCAGQTEIGHRVRQPMLSQSLVAERN